VSDRKHVEKEEEPSPEDPSPKGRNQLRDWRRHHSIPIEKSQNENKKDKEEKESLISLFPP
jgi:hypothetical protein